MANQGIYHPTYNPNGSKKLSDGNFWYNTTIPIASTMDCFDSSKMLTASGNIGTTSGRPDGIFYDQVAENSILDLRNSSKKPEDYNRLISRELNKLAAGTTRGKEGEWEIRKNIPSNPNLLYDYNDGRVKFYTYDLNMNLQIGDTIQVVYFNGTNYISDICILSEVNNDITRSFVAKAANIAPSIPFGYTLNDGTKFFMYSNKSTRTKSNTLLHCDIIGNPANYPASWKQSGVSGTPLIVAEDGTSLLPDEVRDTFKLSRKANATPLLCLRSTDSGATWTSFTPTFNTTANEITLINEPASNLVMVYYQTHTSMAVPTVNSEVIEMGDVNIIQHSNIDQGVHLGSTLTGKVNVSTLAFNINAGKPYNFNILSSTNKILTSPYNLSVVNANTISPAVKVLPYLTRLNGKAYLNLVFKEMKHNGTSWGDDSKFNIVDNVSTTTDTNAATVLIGQKTVELPYFIGADE